MVNKYKYVQAYLHNFWELHEGVKLLGGENIYNIDGICVLLEYGYHITQEDFEFLLSNNIYVPDHESYGLVLDDKKLSELLFFPPCRRSKKNLIEFFMDRNKFHAIH